MGTPGLNAAREILGKRRLRALLERFEHELTTGAYRLGVVAETLYAKKGDAHIAYQVVGEGQPLDVVLVSTWFSHLEARWDLPGYVHYLRRLSSFSRLISFDKYGIGLPIRSDPRSSPARGLDGRRVRGDGRRRARAGRDRRRR